MTHAPEVVGHLCVLAAAKLGSSPDEYEDAVAVAPGEAADGPIPAGVSRLRVTVADGATESMLAGRWAGLLARCAADGAPAPLQVAALTAADRWPQLRADYVAERDERGDPLRWYEEPGIEHGAHATLLVADFERLGDPEGGWAAEAIGDCCLFQVRDDELVHAFPLTASSEFDNQPQLVGSNAPDADRLAQQTRRDGGSWRSGDVFYLCTDALAAWFLAEHDSGGRPWAVWADLDADTFARWSLAERSRHAVKDDDLTVIRLRVH
jgi:hypothetical protein